MRIRSSMTEESLYAESRRQQAGRRTGKKAKWSGNRAASRRLVRLGILLGLVLLLMQQAADPQVYRNFFAALGAPLEPPVQLASSGNGQAPFDQLSQPSRQDSSEETDSSTESVANEVTGDLPTTLDLRAAVEQLGPAQQESLAGWLSQLRRAAVPLAEAVAAQLASAVQGEGGAAASENADETSITPGRMRAALLDPASDRAVIAALQVAVDQAHLRTVSDATIWSGGDRLAFYRLLEAGSLDGFESFGRQATRVGYVALTDQPAAYRGRPVWLDGRAARVERLEAKANPFGIERYWLVWIRPDDGSERPVMAYAASLPPRLAKLAGQTLLENGPATRARGVFLRRHLYQSAKGSELAPVIVGQLQLLDGQTAARAPAAVPETELSGGKLTWLVAIALLLAVGLTLLVALQTARAGKWQRQMRQRGLPNQLEKPPN